MGEVELKKELEELKVQLQEEKEKYSRLLHYCWDLEKMNTRLSQEGGEAFKATAEYRILSGKLSQMEEQLSSTKEMLKLAKNRNAGRRKNSRKMMEKLHFFQRLHDQGKTKEEIMELMRISQNSYYRYLRNLQPEAVDRYRQFVLLKESGMKRSQIIEMAGISPATYARYLKKYQESIQEDQLKAKTSEK